MQFIFVKVGLPIVILLFCLNQFSDESFKRQKFKQIILLDKKISLTLRHNKRQGY